MLLALALRLALGKLGDIEGVPTLLFLQDHTRKRCDFGSWAPSPVKCHAERKAVEFSWNCTLTNEEKKFLKEITPSGCSHTDFVSYSGNYGLTNNALMSFSNLLYSAHRDNRTAVLPHKFEEFFSIPKYFDLATLKKHVCLIDEKDMPKDGKLHVAKSAGDYFKGRAVLHMGSRSRQMRLLVLKLLFGYPVPKLRNAVNRFYSEVLVKAGSEGQNNVGYAAVHHRNLKGLRKECIPWLSECIEVQGYMLSVPGVKPIKVQTNKPT
jgi:hypothetical protein